MTDLTKNLMAWQEVGETLRKQLAGLHKEALKPLFAAQLAFEKAIEPFLESQARATAAAQSMLTQYADLSRISLPQFTLLDESVLRYANEMAHSMLDVVAPAFESFHESMRQLPPRTQAALLVLASNGWYTDFEWTMPQLWALEESLRKDDAQEAEKELIEHFEARLDGIEKSLVDKVPHRAHLIQSAFGAHRRKEYELAIPVLLAQTDGICKESTEKYLFIRSDKKPEVAVYVEQSITNAFMIALLSPLCEILPIAASHRDRAADTQILNRHAVMHGESLKYGSQANSLRAISLINYVAHVL